jgi:hypothetical protein
MKLTLTSFRHLKTILCCEECGGEATFSPSLERVKTFFQGRLYMYM